MLGSGWNVGNIVEASIVDCYTIKDSIMRFLDTNTAENNEKFITILWSIWGERNNRVWQNKETTAAWVVKLGLNSLREWQEVQHPSTARNVEAEVKCMKWYPPNQGTVTCNVDVALFNEERRTGFGRVARDHTGRVLHFFMLSKPGLGIVREGEDEAIFDALSWMEGEGIMLGVVESDAQDAVRAITAGKEDASEFGDIVRRCQSLLTRNPGFGVKFVKRVQNEIAHELARRSCSCASPVCGEDSRNWMHEMLTNICTVHH